MSADVSKYTSASLSIYPVGRQYDKIIYPEGGGSGYSETSVYFY